MRESAKLSRAEAVRQRRNQRGTQRLSEAGEKALRPLPSVTTRNRPYGAQPAAPIGAQRRGQAAVALPRPMGDTRVPALPHLGTRAMPLGLALAFTAAILLAFNLGYFRVTAPLISGNARLSSEEISAVLAANGQPIFALRPDELASRLRLNFPELAHANARVYFPNKIWVRIEERTPLILWQEGDGYTWIDRAGVAFRPRGEAPGLITVYASSSPPAGPAWPDDALSPPAFLAPELVEMISAIAPAVPAGTPITYDARNGLGWRDPRGWQVSFGISTRDISLKLRVYQTLADSLSTRGMSPEFVSVAYADAPFYRMAEGSDDCPAYAETCPSLTDE